MNAFLQKLKAKWLAVWQHRTKFLGAIFGLAGYIQNNYAASGIHIPSKYEGSLLGVAGFLTFTLGLYNWLTRPNAPGSGSDPPSP
jgi:hypothetical protein